MDFTTRFSRGAENSEMGYFLFSLFGEKPKREKLQPFGHETSFKKSLPADPRSNGDAAQRLWFSSVPPSGTDERINQTLRSPWLCGEFKTNLDVLMKLQLKRIIQIIGRQTLNAVFRDQNRLFKLGREGSIIGNRGPPIA